MFQELFGDFGKFVDLTTNIIIAVFIVLLICIEIFSKKRNKKPGIFYMLLVIALIAYLPNIFNLTKLNFSVTNFNSWLSLINCIGLPTYTIILIIKR